MSMMGEFYYFLGFQIKQLKEDIFINQAKYIKDFDQEIWHGGCKPTSTLMSTTTKLDSDEGGKSVDIKLYRSMIGSLLYLTASRPYIMFSVCLYTRFQSNPKESHVITVKRIFDTLNTHLILDFGIQKIHPSTLLLIQMPTTWEVELIARVQVALANS